MGHAKTMSTITAELTIKVKNKFTSSSAEKTKWIHLTHKREIFTPPFETNSITAIYCYLCYVSICNPVRLRQNRFCQSLSRKYTVELLAKELYSIHPSSSTVFQEFQLSTYNGILHRSNHHHSVINHKTLDV